MSGGLCTTEHYYFLQWQKLAVRHCCAQADLRHGQEVGRREKRHDADHKWGHGWVQTQGAMITRDGRRREKGTEGAACGVSFLSFH